MRPGDSKPKRSRQSNKCNDIPITLNTKDKNENDQIRYQINNHTKVDTVGQIDQSKQNLNVPDVIFSPRNWRFLPTLDPQVDFWIFQPKMKDDKDGWFILT